MDLIGINTFVPFYNLTMKVSLSTTCPVSCDRINGNAARAAAFYTILLTGLAMYTGNYYINLLLALDFGIRSFGPARYSLVRMLSVATVNLLQLPVRPVDAAPKKFAAGLGMSFALAIAVLQFLHQPVFAMIIWWMLAICAFLEGAFAFCLGCIIYTFLNRIFPNKNHPPSRQ